MSRDERKDSRRSGEKWKFQRSFPRPRSGRERWRNRARLMRNSWARSVTGLTRRISAQLIRRVAPRALVRHAVARLHRRGSDGADTVAGNRIGGRLEGRRSRRSRPSSGRRHSGLRSAHLPSRERRSGERGARDGWTTEETTPRLGEARRGCLSAAFRAAKLTLRTATLGPAAFAELEASSRKERGHPADVSPLEALRAKHSRASDVGGLSIGSARPPPDFAERRRGSARKCALGAGRETARPGTYRVRVRIGSRGCGRGARENQKVRE
ncbi:hypothetical protein KM043_001739 [Ampulex compressa]|nr:hypothetical protein KM043_001739 [Ampulex compressa]